MADVQDRVLAAIASKEPLAALRRVLTEELDGGARATDLLALLQAMRSDLTEEQEDDVLVGMDWLTGRRSPGERLPEN